MPHVRAEEEVLGVGDTDLVLWPNKDSTDIVGRLIVFKCLKKSKARQSAIDAKTAEAEAQLNRYAAAVFSDTELEVLKVV